MPNLDALLSGAHVLGSQPIKSRLVALTVPTHTVACRHHLCSQTTPTKRRIPQLPTQNTGRRKQMLLRDRQTSTTSLHQGRFTSVFTFKKPLQIYLQAFYWKCAAGSGLSCLVGQVGKAVAKERSPRQRRGEICMLCWAFSTSAGLPQKRK